jgi:hypothetical protein
MTKKSGKALAMPSATPRRSRKVQLPPNYTQELPQNDQTDNQNQYVIYIFIFSLLATVLGFASFIVFL